MHLGARAGPPFHDLDAEACRGLQQLSLLTRLQLYKWHGLGRNRAFAAALHGLHGLRELRLRTLSPRTLEAYCVAAAFTKLVDSWQASLGEGVVVPSLREVQLDGSGEAPWQALPNVTSLAFSYRRVPSEVACISEHCKALVRLRLLHTARAAFATSLEGWAPVEERLAAVQSLARRAAAGRDASARAVVAASNRI